MTGRRTWWSRLVPALVTLVCVAVAAIAVNTTSHDKDPQILRSVPGAALSLNEGTVTVASPRVCDTLLDGGQAAYRTTGMFVVVPVRVAATHAVEIRVDSLVLTSGDRTYRPYDVYILIAAPGFAETMDVVFEVDPAGIEGLTLVAGRLEVVSGYQQQVRVPLGFTPQNLDEWRNKARGSAMESDTGGVTTVIA